MNILNLIYIILYYLQNFRREEQNFVAQMEAENAALLAATMSGRKVAVQPADDRTKSAIQAVERERRIEGLGSPSSLVVVSLKRLLPVGMNLYGAREQEFIQQGKLMFQQVGFVPIPYTVPVVKLRRPELRGSTHFVE